MTIKPKAFEPVNDPHASAFTDLHQNLFHLRGISDGRTFTRIYSPIGLGKFDPNAIYVKVEAKKPFGVTDFLSTVGKILFIATGIFPLILLIAHLIDYNSKKQRYFVVEEKSGLFSTVMGTPKPEITGSSESKSQQGTGSLKNPTHHLGSSNLSSSLLPQPNNAAAGTASSYSSNPVPALINLSKRSIKALSDDEFGQITLGQIASLSPEQKREFDERVWTLALQNMWGKMSSNYSAPIATYYPNSAAEIPISQLSKLMLISIQNHIAAIPPQLWSLLPDSVVGGLPAVIRKMSQSDFDRLVGPDGIKDLERLKPEVYRDKLTDQYLPYLSKEQIARFFPDIEAPRLHLLNLDGMIFLESIIDMKTISIERFKGLLGLVNPQLSPLVSQDRIKMLTLQQIHDCFARPELSCIKKLVGYFDDIQLQSLTLAQVASLSEDEIDEYRSKTRDLALERFSDDQLKAMLPKIRMNNFGQQPKIRIIGRIDFSQVDQNQFDKLFSPLDETWYEGLEESFILKLYANKRLSPTHIAYLPKDIFQKLDLNVLSDEQKKFLGSGLIVLLSPSGNKFFTMEDLRAKCTVAQMKIILEAQK